MKFVKLTCSVTNRPLWYNMARVTFFGLDESEDTPYTTIFHGDDQTDSSVKESPEEIMLLINS